TLTFSLAGPVTTALAGQTYTYPVKAVDPDNDPLTYSLTTAPTGMVISRDSGLIEWNPVTSKYATWSSTAGYVRAEGLAADPQGNMFSAGYFTGTISFQSAQGTVSFSADPGLSEGYVTKRDPNGDLLWALHVDSSGGNVGVHKIASDSQGN